VDVLVNLPIAKHHVGTNVQRQSQEHDGAASITRPTAFFHAGSGKTGYEDVDSSHSCIADLNTLRRQNLCVVDATIVLGTNGSRRPRRQSAEAAENIVAASIRSPSTRTAYPGTAASRKRW